MASHTTPDGIEYGLHGAPSGPAVPTLLVAASTLAESFEPWALQAGVLLGAAGYQCVTIDLPSHGSQAEADQPEGLLGWAHTVAAGGDPGRQFVERMSRVLDHLIGSGRTAPDLVAAVGPSRGGYLALRLAAVDPRVRAVAAYAPVTDLRRLTEFASEPAASRAAGLALHHLVDALVATPVFVAIGDRDTRVDTDAAIAFARALSAAAHARETPAAVALHVLPEVQDHVTPAPAALLSALWLDDVLLAGGRTIAGQTATERAPDLIRRAALSPRTPA